MIGRNLPQVTPALPSSHRSFNSTIALTAKTLNEPRREIEKFGRMRGGAGIAVWDTPAGPQIRSNAPATMYIQLTGPAGDDGSYPWQEVIRVKESGFVASGNKGTNVSGAPYYSPAYESQTGDTTLTADGTTYFATQNFTSGVWLFDGKN